MRSVTSIAKAFALPMLFMAALPIAALADNDSRERGNPDDAYYALPPNRQLESIPPSQKGGRDNPLREHGATQAPPLDEQLDSQDPAAENVGFWRWPFGNDDPYYDRSRRFDDR